MTSIEKQFDNTDIGVFFKICRPIRCAYCSEPHDCLCDFELEWGGTCDKPICRKHSVKGDTDTQDFCKQHKQNNEKPTTDN